ncbi:hypothetical protein DRJ17_00705 [Candidatus Woesearchaeota archaeon]|nr:MAG: hypothetical protein DRJ17_00705 [Candidatus Woesearchaeota archaeon]
MDSKSFLTILKYIEDSKLPREVISKLRSKCVDISGELLPSTTDRNIKRNIKLINELEELFKSVAEKHNTDFPDIFCFFKGYKDSVIIHESIEEDSRVPAAMIESLQIRCKTNSVIKISEKFNYQQIKVITRRIFDAHPNSPLVFPITKYHHIEGKVIGEIEQRKIKIPVAWKVEISTKEDKTYVPYLFGEKIPKRTKIVDEVSGEFYLYRFLSKERKEYALISTDRLKLDDYSIDGISIEVEDFKIIGDAYRLINKFTVFFVHTAKSHICQLQNHKQLFEHADKLKLTGNRLYQYLSSYRKNGSIQVLEHPKWFLKLTSAFLFHKKKGDTAEYPMHILWISERGAGKTTFMESLHQKSGETQEIIAGSASTIKYLIPSFKETNRPDMGALAKASRLCIIDEFFRILRTSHKEREDESGRMNDLLEHKDRQAGSGQGKVRTSMTARLFAGTNPIAGTNNIVNLVEKFDDSFLSRFLIYYQTDDHVKLVHQKKKEAKVYTTEWIEVNDFLSIQDYLQSFDAKYNRERLVKIFDKFLIFFNEEVKGIYEARYLHHLECLIDGIIKTRCLITRDPSFKAKEEDYQEAEYIWAIIIKGWFRQNLDDILRDLSIPIESRARFLPENAVYLLEKLASLGYKAKLGDLRDKCRGELHAPSIAFYLSLLKEGAFVIERDGYLYHHEWEAIERK